MIPKQTPNSATVDYTTNVVSGVIDVAPMATNLELRKPRHYDTMACRQLTEVANAHQVYFGREAR